VNAVLPRPLGYPEPDRIVQFLFRSDGEAVETTSIPILMLWREQTQALQDFALYAAEGRATAAQEFIKVAGVNLTGGDRPERLRSIHVSADYFRLFGASVEIGRTFTAQEDVPGGPRVVVISDGLWRQRFGADRSLVGRAIQLGGEPNVVIGVLDPSFHTDPPSDVWVPARADIAPIRGQAGALRPA
jgi:hypothetical protein